MANKSLEKCIELILADIEKRKAVDYGDRLSVSRYNAAYTRIMRHAQYIDTHYPCQIEDFVSLIQHPDTAVVSCCAPIVLKLNSCSYQQKQAAIEAIETLISGDKLSKLDKLGFSVSLRKWKEELKQE